MNEKPLTIQFELRFGEIFAEEALKEAMVKYLLEKQRQGESLGCNP